MTNQTRIRLWLLAAIAAIGGVVWFVGHERHTAAEGDRAQIQSSHQLLVGMLEQEFALIGYATTGEADFLEHSRTGKRRFDVAAVELRARVHEDGEAAEQRELADELAIARRWQAAADGIIASRLQDRGSAQAATFERLEKLDPLFHGFRAANDRFEASRELDNKEIEKRAQLLSIAAIGALGLLFGGLGYLLLERRLRSESWTRRRQSEFIEAIQASRTDQEAYDVLKRHLERLVRRSRAIVLNRNNSADRLEPRTDVPEGWELRERLEGAQPEDCLAIRLAKRHEASADEGPGLLACEICSCTKHVTCLPSVVGGEVIGSVLVDHGQRPSQAEIDQLSRTVVEAAPVIANLRNLKLAEIRAATDSLTGLPNYRAAQETLKRMVAQAGRTMSPLAAVLLDLDHFKHVNDLYGHGKGDEVLAAVGDAIASSIRGGDFASRTGGEEFLLLLPGTDQAGALTVAETLRKVLPSLRIPGVERVVTASFGVAVLPDDAGDAEHLLRSADRALYTAKANGRDRIEVPATTSPAQAA